MWEIQGHRSDGAVWQVPFIRNDDGGRMRRQSDESAFVTVIGQVARHGEVSHVVIPNDQILPVLRANRQLHYVVFGATEKSL